MQKEKSEIKAGAILAYILIISNTVYGLLISPYVMKNLGSADYGVYKTIASFTASLGVLDLGFAGTVMRYTAKYKAEKNKKSLENFLGMSLVQIGIMSGVVALVSTVLIALIPVIYGKSFDAAQLTLARELFVLLAFNIILHFFENILYGAINGTGKFIFSNVAKLWMIVFRGALIYILLPFVSSPLTVVGIETALTVCVVIAELFFLYRRLQIRIKLYQWDKVVFKESFGYTILLFLQSIFVQFNGNVDNVVIGALNVGLVTIYSFSLQLFNMYENLSSSFANLFLPKITNQIHAGASIRELENTVIEAGRFQFAILGAALTGVIVVGRDFFTLWLGKGFEDCWYLSMILMIPVTLPLVENVCLSILRAKNLMWFRTLSMGIALIANCILTIAGTILTRNYWMAAIGTAASTLIGSILMMNIYYHKKLGINVFRMFYGIFRRIILCLLVAGAALFVADRFISGTWIYFLIKVAVFGIVYLAMLWFYGLTGQEKTSLLKRGSKTP